MGCVFFFYGITECKKPSRIGDVGGCCRISGSRNHRLDSKLSELINPLSSGDEGKHQAKHGAKSDAEHGGLPSLTIRRIGMDLRTTHVNKSLDRRLLILGFEVFDLILVFGFLSILNFTLGRFGLTFFTVWMPTLILALILRIGKTGKADRFLIHYIKYQIKPKLLDAFNAPRDWQSPPSCKKEVR